MRTTSAAFQVLTKVRAKGSESRTYKLTGNVAATVVVLTVFTLLMWLVRDRVHIPVLFMLREAYELWIRGWGAPHEAAQLQYLREVTVADEL
jgi:hypothetical protein